MAKPFVLNAEIALKAVNVSAVVSSIKKQLGSGQYNLNLKVNGASGNAIQGLSTKLKTLTGNLHGAQSAAAALNVTIGQLGHTMNSVLSGQQQKGFNSIVTSTNKVKTAVASTTNEFARFGAQSALTLRRVAAYSIAGGSIYGLISAIKGGITQAIHFDKELVRLSQVTGSSVQNLKGLSSEVTRLSVGLGVSSRELIDVTSTLAQAGLSANETKKALDALAKSSLAPSFENMNQTVEGSIAILQQFDLKAKDLEATLGSVNTVAAAFAVESKDIVSAVKIAGSAFAAASHGLADGKEQLNQFISLFTSVRQTTRESAEAIATGLRTIFTRIERPKTIEYLKQFGINLTDLQGKFVGPYEAVRRLSEGIKDLDSRDLKFFQISEELGGYRNLSRTIPLIQQFAVSEKALGVAHQGTASLSRDAATAQQSLAVQIARVREEFLALTRDIVTSTGFKEMAKMALNLASSFIQIGNSLKSILPYLTALSAIKLGVSGANFLSGFVGNFRSGSRHFASGGIVSGSGSGDTVPAMLTPGEFVLNKNTSQKIGYGALHSLNLTGVAQHFARGGKVLSEQDLLDKQTKVIKRYYDYILKKYGMSTDSLGLDVGTQPRSQMFKPSYSGEFWNIGNGKIRIASDHFSKSRKNGVSDRFDSAVAGAFGGGVRKETLLHELGHALDYIGGGNSFLSYRSGHRFNTIGTSDQFKQITHDRLTMMNLKPNTVKQYVDSPQEVLVQGALTDKNLYHSMFNQVQVGRGIQETPRTSGIFQQIPISPPSKFGSSWEPPFISPQGPYGPDLPPVTPEGIYGPFPLRRNRKEYNSRHINGGNLAANFANHFDAIRGVTGSGPQIAAYGRLVGQRGINPYTAFGGTGTYGDNFNTVTHGGIPPVYGPFINSRQRLMQRIRGYGSNFGNTAAGRGIGFLGNRGYSSGGLILGGIGAFAASQLGEAQNEHEAGLHGILHGASGGALLGSSLGPLGLAGGIIGGAALGHADSRFEFKERRGQKNFEKSLKELDEAFEHINQSGGLKKFNDALTKTSDKIESLNQARSTKFDAGGSSISLLSAGLGANSTFGRGNAGANRSLSRAADELGFGTYLVNSVGLGAGHRGIARAEQRSINKEAASRADIYRQSQQSALGLAEKTLRSDTEQNDRKFQYKEIDENELKLRQGQSIENILKNGDIQKILGGGSEDLQRLKIQHDENQKRLSGQQEEEEGKIRFRQGNINRLQSYPSIGGFRDSAINRHQNYINESQNKISKLKAQIGGSAGQISQKEKEEATALLKPLQERIEKEKQLENIMRSAATATQLVTDKFIAMESQIDRLGAESDKFTSAGETISNRITGSTNIAHLASAANVFTNPRAYGTKEIADHINSLGGTLGFSADQTNDLRQNFVGGKIINEQLGTELKKVQGNNQLGSVDDVMDEVFTNLSRNNNNFAFHPDMVRHITAQIKGEEGEDSSGKPFNLNNIVEKYSTRKGMAGPQFEGAQKTLIEGQLATEKALAKFTDGINHYTQLYLAANEKQLDAEEMVTNHQLDMARIMGKELTVGQLSGGVTGRIRSLSGGATDVSGITGNINKLYAENDNIEQQRRDIPAADLDGKSRLADVLQKNNIEINKNNQALKILATDTTRLSAITGKLADEQQKRDGARNVVDRLLGASPQEMQQIFRENVSYQKSLNVGVSGQEYQFAKAGLENRLSVTQDEDEKKKLRDEFYRINVGRIQGGVEGKNLQETLGLAGTKQGGTVKEQNLIQQMQNAQKEQQKAGQAQADLAHQDLPKFLANLGAQFGNFLDGLNNKKTRVQVDLHNAPNSPVAPDRIFPLPNAPVRGLDPPNAKFLIRGGKRIPNPLLFKPRRLDHGLNSLPDHATSVRIGDRVLGGSALDNLRKADPNNSSLKAADDKAKAKLDQFNKANADRMWGAANKFSDAARQLNNLKIPERIDINLNTIPNLNVNITGIAGIEQKMKGDILNAVLAELRKHMNLLTGETKEGYG